MKCFVVIQNGLNMLTTPDENQSVPRKQFDSQQTEFSDTAGSVKIFRQLWQEGCDDSLHSSCLLNPTVCSLVDVPIPVSIKVLCWL